MPGPTHAISLSKRRFSCQCLVLEFEAWDSTYPTHLINHEKEVTKAIAAHDDNHCLIRSHFEQLTTKYGFQSSLSLPDKIKQTAEKSTQEKDFDEF